MNSPYCLLIALLCASFLSACVGGSGTVMPDTEGTDGNGVTVPGGSGSSALRPSGSDEELEAYLKATLLANYGQLQQHYDYLEVADSSGVIATPVASTAESSETTAFSHNEFAGRRC